MRCVKTKDRYNNANSRSPRGEIGRHKGLKNYVQGLRHRINYLSEVKKIRYRAVF